MNYRTPHLVGQIIENRYQVLNVVGEGGMAHVYRAKIRNVDCFVAIKVLKRHEMFSQTDIERLKREAKALQRLTHPNIVKAYSLGFLDSGEPYIILDYLHGQNLDDYMQAHPGASVQWLLNVFMQICRGLACAHDNGLIHRDLKPSNVMVVETDGAMPVVKLLDFGTAKSAVSQPDELQLTAKGIIFGSPFYISPEQIGGKTFDKRTDIYSFGCLMYEMLTGRLPHSGRTEMDTLMKHMHESPAAFSQFEKSRQVPACVEEIVLKCMSKDPDTRFQTVADLERELSKAATSITI